MYISIIIFGAIFSMIGFCTAEIANIDLHPMWQFLPIDQCGYGSLSDRIVGGKEATLGQFPWIARIGYKTKRTGTKIVYLCAGSLINPRYVLSANHCFFPLDSRNESIKHVRFGENFIKSSRDCEDGFCAPPVQDIAVAAIIRHKNSFSEPSLTYGDIALIRLAQPVKYNDFVLPICLPRGEVVRHIQDYLSNGTLLEVAGWGSINPKKTVIPNKLMSVGLPVVNIKVCQKIFNYDQIDESQICMGIGKGKDSCVGDSGGPLMKPIALEAPPRYFLFGIVSFGSKLCGISAAIYTNVTHYLPWILDNMEPH